MTRPSSVTKPVMLAGHQVLLTRKPIRSIRLKVTRDGGLAISAPPPITLAQLEALVASKQAWIARQQRLLAQTQDAEDRLEDGGAVVLWGRRLRVQRVPGRAAVLSYDDQRVLLRADSDEAAARAVTRWRATLLLAEAQPLADVWVPRLEVPAPSVIRTRAMTSRWGSCNHRTRAITLNTWLSRHPLAAMEYVLVHELAHLAHPSHSAQFWELVAKRLPDYANRAALLRVY